jgi:hypothetical protein
MITTSSRLFPLAAGLFLLLSLLPGRAAAAGTTVTPEVALTNVRVSHDGAAAHSEPAIAENPSNPNDLVAGSKFFTDTQNYIFQIGTYHSSDGGRTWKDYGLLPGFDKNSIVSDISFAFSPNGSLVYAAALACAPVACPDPIDSSGIYVWRSRDGGKTWSDPATVFVDTTGQTFQDKPWIAVDGTHGPGRGTVYVGWNLDSFTDADRAENPGRAAASPDARIRPNQVAGGPKPGLVVARSTDYGQSFSAPVTIAPFDNAHFAIGAIPAVAPNGTLYVTYLAYTGAGNNPALSIDQASSTNHGKSFSAPRAILASVNGLPNHLPHSTFRNMSMPTFAISPADGSMVVAWADERFGDADVLATHSVDGGRTWSAPIRVNHDPRKDGKDQFQPELAVAPNGTYTCSWFDRRYDPNDTLIDVDVAQSANDGRSFGVNVRVTRHSWDPKIDAPEPEGHSSNTFIGDYQALAVDNTTVHPLWNDTQNGSTQEIRTAVVSVGIFARR